MFLQFDFGAVIVFVSRHPSACTATAHADVDAMCIQVPRAQARSPRLKNKARRAEGAALGARIFQRDALVCRA